MPIASVCSCLSQPAWKVSPAGSAASVSPLRSRGVSPDGGRWSPLVQTGPPSQVAGRREAMPAVAQYSLVPARARSSSSTAALTRSTSREISVPHSPLFAGGRKLNNLFSPDFLDLIVTNLRRWLQCNPLLILQSLKVVKYLFLLKRMLMPGEYARGCHLRLSAPTALWQMPHGSPGAAGSLGLPEVKDGFSDVSSHSGLERRAWGFATSDSSRLLSEIFLAGAESESFLFAKAKQ